MNTCQKCGNTLSLETKFCNVCGEKIIHKVFCTNCGRELKEERFCPDCGTLSPTLRTFNSNPTQQFSGTYQGSTYQAQQYNYTRPTTNNKKSFIKIDRVHQIETAACQNEDNNSSENESPNAPTKSLVLLWCYAIGGFILFGLGLWLIIMDVFDLSVVDFDSKKQSKMLAKALIGIVAGGVITVRYIREICKYKNLNDKN